MPLHVDTPSSARARPRCPESSLTRHGTKYRAASPAAEPGDTITLSHENAARRLQSRLRGTPRTSLTGLVAPCPSQTAEETRHRGTPCGSFTERMTFLPVDTPAGDLHCRSDLQEPAARLSRL